ncbi:MAG: prepilin peptidase [Acidimicrobiales bacterium]|nr:prepilin peptidase [Acidimicrobiales bacterium]
MSLSFVILAAGLAGLLVGSFLNVVVYRIPRGLSVSGPRSFCPTCNRQLTWWENVPVVSWVALRGRCRTCHQLISIRYPLVELGTGAAFALVTWGWDGTIVSAAYCVLAATMVAVSLIEYDGKRAPLSVAAIGTGIALVIIFVGAGRQGHWWLVGGSVIGAAVGLVAVSLLRARDPECLDPREFGRSTLVVAGCWFGGLGLRPTAFGAVTWVVVYFLCMLGVWTTRQRTAASGGVIATGRSAVPLLNVPLVSALALAMPVALIARG